MFIEAERETRFNPFKRRHYIFMSLADKILLTYTACVRPECGFIIHPTADDYDNILYDGNSSIRH